MHAMNSPRRTAIALTLGTLWLGAPSRSDAQEPAAPAAPQTLASLLPPKAAAYAELPAPHTLWRTFVDTGAWDRIRSTLSYRQGLQGNGVKLVAGIAAIQAAIGMELPDAIDRCFGGGAAVALVPRTGLKKGPPTLVAVARAKDAAALTAVRNALADLAGLRDEVDGWLRPQVTVHKSGDVEIVSTKADAYHAIDGEWFVLSNERSEVESVIQRLRGKERGSLEDHKNFVAAKAAAIEERRDLFAWLDAEGATELLGDRNREQPALEPFAALLFDGLRQSLLGSSWIAGSAALSEEALALSLRTSARPAKAAPAFLPEPTAIEKVAVPRQIASLTLRRDASAFWDLHDEIVSDEFEAEMEKFNSTTALIFNMKRLDEELLPKLAPAAQIVVARQTYAGLPQSPKVKIPAFALVLHSRDRSKKFLESFAQAFRTGVFLVSADRAQKGLSPLGASEVSVGDLKIPYASFPELEEGQEATPEYNFTPAMFTRGTKVVLSSSLELAKELAQVIPDDIKIPADRNRDGKGEPALLEEGPIDELVIDGAESIEALRENLDVLVANEMLEKGKSKAEARRGFQGLLDILSLFSGVDAQSVARKDGMELRLDLRRAPAPRTAPRESDPPASAPRKVSR